MDKTFFFELGDAVKLVGSPEQGTVVGRAQYVGSENQYLLRYQDGTGCLVNRWWGQDALERAPTRSRKAKRQATI